MSTALIELREALKLTQQRFAVEVMHVAINTIGRWESTLPPTGGVLLTMADIAHRNNLIELSNTFSQFYMDEWIQMLGSLSGVVMQKSGTNEGYLAIKLQGPGELLAANRFVDTVRKIREARRKRGVSKQEEKEAKKRKLIAKGKGSR
jgi:hypothetical protein